MRGVPPAAELIGLLTRGLTRSFTTQSVINRMTPSCITYDVYDRREGANHMAEEFEKVLTFEIERDGDTAVVKCHGRLVAGTSEELYQEVKDLLAQTKVVVVDLADLAYVDSSGLGTLVRLHASARKLGCEFKLLHLGKQLRNVLKLTNLLSVFAQAEDHGINIA
jgi:anti-sigma B factor antagonist